MQDAKHKPPPLPPKPDFDEDFTAPALDQKSIKEYQATIGSLRYLADSTRLNIAYATSRLAQFSHKPTKKHLELMKHVLRYLKGTNDHGILYGKSDEPELLETYADADYAAARDRHSQEGAVYTSFGSPIGWQSNRQKTIALSTCEAEYLAASHALQETQWLRRVLFDIQPAVGTLNTTPLHIDNQSAVKMTTNQGKTKRRKHIDMRHHHIQLAHKLKQINARHIATELNKSDILTKALGKIIHKRQMLLNRILTRPSLDHQRM